MRFREIILEYDRSKTLVKYQNAVILRLRGSDWEELYDDFNDPLYARSVEEMEQLAVDGSERIVKFVLNNVLARCESVDPTTKKAFVLPILNWFLKGNIRLLEDLYKVTDPLETYARLRNRFKGLDLMQVKFDEFDAQMTAAGGEKSRSEEKSAEEEALFESGAAELFRNDTEVKIVIPHTVEASRYFGRNTKWCTAAREDRNNLFDRYASKGPLYIVLIRSTGQRWQFHFETASFMDEADSPLPTNTVLDSPVGDWVDETSRQMIGQYPRLFKMIRNPDENQLRAFSTAGGGIDFMSLLGEGLEAPDEIIRHAMHDFNVNAHVAARLFKFLDNPTDEDADYITKKGQLKDLPDEWRTRQRQMLHFVLFGNVLFTDPTPEEISKIVDMLIDRNSPSRIAEQVVERVSTQKTVDQNKKSLARLFAAYPILTMHAEKVPWVCMKPAFIKDPNHALQGLYAMRDQTKTLPLKTVQAIYDIVSKSIPDDYRLPGIKSTIARRLKNG